MRETANGAAVAGDSALAMYKHGYHMYFIPADSLLGISAYERSIAHGRTLDQLLTTCRSPRGMADVTIVNVRPYRYQRLKANLYNRSKGLERCIIFLSHRHDKLVELDPRLHELIDLFSRANEWYAKVVQQPTGSSRLGTEGSRDSKVPQEAERVF